MRILNDGPLIAQFLKMILILLIGYIFIFVDIYMQDAHKSSQKKDSFLRMVEANLDS
jgi:hypothetical protein